MDEVCPISLEPYEATVPLRRPRLLPCGHSVCTECILLLNAGRAPRCPQDTAPFVPPVNGLQPINFALEANLVPLNRWRRVAHWVRRHPLLFILMILAAFAIGWKTANWAATTPVGRPNVPWVIGAAAFAAISLMWTAAAPVGVVAAAATYLGLMAPAAAVAVVPPVFTTLAATLTGVCAAPAW